MWLWLRLREDEATILVVFWSSVYFGSFAGHYWGKLRKGGWNIKDTVTTCKWAVAKDNRPVIKKLLGGYGALRKKGWGGGEKGRQGSVVFHFTWGGPSFKQNKKKLQPQWNIVIYVAWKMYLFPISLYTIHILYVSFTSRGRKQKK